MVKLFEYTVIQEQDMVMEGTAEGNILFSPTTGGYFKGEKLSGTILPFYGSVLTYEDVRNTGNMDLLLKTDDDALILMRTKSYLELPAEIEERINAGEKVDSSEYYFKGHCDFLTGDERYKWLERKICVVDVQIDDWEHVTSTVYML